MRDYQILAHIVRELQNYALPKRTTSQVGALLIMPSTGMYAESSEV
jgi:hypothetical protein